LSSDQDWDFIVADSVASSTSEPDVFHVVGNTAASPNKPCFIGLLNAGFSATPFVAVAILLGFAF
jgi:hypothetical protein